MHAELGVDVAHVGLDRGDAQAELVAVSCKLSDDAGLVAHPAGLMRVSVTSRLGGRMSTRPDFVIGSSRRRLKSRGGPVPAGLAGADGRTARFRDGTTLETGIIIWATGFRPDYSWIGIPGVIRDGKVVHQRGVTGVPGLYFLGLSWQHTRGSALLGFVDDDAAYLAGHITTDAQATQPAHPQTAPPRTA